MEIHNQTFRARQIAATQNCYKNITTKIDLYKLSRNDSKFLDKLEKSIDMGNLVPDLCEYSQKRWQKVFNYAISRAKSGENETYVAISDAKPCGIVTTCMNNNEILIDAISDIPQRNKRINYTGSTLFLQLFKMAENLKAKTLKLFAITDGPFDVITKYKEMGFKDVGMADGYVEMTCNKYNIKKQIDNLSKSISYKPVRNANELSLEELI